MKRLIGVIILLLWSSLCSAQGWLPFAVSQNFINDGASLPETQTPIGPSVFYNSSTQTNWFCWEGWQSVNGTMQRVAEVATFSTSWTGNYVAGTRTLASSDPHGVPACAQDSAGYVYLFYGSHNSSLRVSASGAANDPSSWSDIYTIAGTYTFPNPQVVGSTIYLFTSGPGAGTDNQEALTVTPITTSAGVPTFGTRKTLFDSATAGNTGWLPIGNAQVVGTKIHIVFAFGAATGSAPTAAYYAVYDTTNGTVCNYSGGTCVVAASQPIGLTSLNANFKIYSSTRNGFPSLTVDGGGVSHVLIADGAASPAVLNHIQASGGGSFSAPLTVYTWPVAVDAFNGEGGQVVNAQGNLDIYFGDGTGGCGFPLSGGTPGGNMLRKTLVSGVLGSSVVIRSAQGKCIDNPQPIANASANARVIFTETSIDETTIDGHLRGWVYGDNGTVYRQGCCTVLPTTIPQTAAFLARSTCNDATHVNAYTALINGLGHTGLLGKLDAYYMLATCNAATAQLNLLNSNFTLTLNGSPTFTTDRGYTGTNASSIWLDSGYTPTINAINYQTADASLVGWTLTSSSSYSGDNIGAFVSGGNTAVCSFSSATTLGTRLNATTTFPTITVASDIGFFGCTRLVSDGSHAVLYYGASTSGTVTQGTGPSVPSVTLKLLSGGTGDGAAAQMAMGGWGGGLTPTDMANLYALSHTYLQAVGAAP